MITKISKLRWLLLAMAICLISMMNADAQRATGGGGGGGGGGTGGRGTGGFGGGGSSSSGSSTTKDYPNSTTVGSITMSVDPETHEVVIITDDQTWQHVQTVISNLDRPKPQVLIKVVFLEVQHSDDVNLGVESSYGHQFSPSSSTSLSNVFGLVGSGALPFSPATIGSSTMPEGAGIYSVMGSDFQATLTAIASAQKTEILSRPSILVRNNQPATITVGQEVPLVTGITYAGTLGTLPVSTISYTSVGIILNVTPFITADGLVEMIVSPQISDVSSANGQVIASGITAPALDIRSASTVVVTPDGQTVMIGGLMESDKASVDSKIPLLGDIPGLGFLFKHQLKDNTKKELMIFLTPHVIQMATDLEDNRATSSRNRPQLVPGAFTEDEIERFLDKLPLKTSGSSKYQWPKTGSPSTH